MPTRLYKLTNIFYSLKLIFFNVFNIYTIQNLIRKSRQNVTVCYNGQSKSDAIVQNDFSGISPMM